MITWWLWEWRTTKWRRLFELKLLSDWDRIPEELKICVIRFKPVQKIYWNINALSSTCLRKVPVINQKLLLMLNWFSITSFSTTLKKTNKVAQIGKNSHFLHQWLYVHIPWMWIVPFIGRESGHHEKSEADEDIRSQHISESLSIWLLVLKTKDNEKDKT